MSFTEVQPDCIHMQQHEGETCLATRSRDPGWGAGACTRAPETEGVRRWRTGEGQVNMLVVAFEIVLFGPSLAQTRVSGGPGGGTKRRPRGGPWRAGPHRVVCEQRGANSRPSQQQ